MKNQEHLTGEGLNKIVGFKEKMNMGISPYLKKAFPNRTPVARPIVKDQTIYDPNWFAGFTSAEGCYRVKITKCSAKIGFSVQLVFTITKDSKDEKLMRSLVKYLCCGKIYKNRDAFDFIVTKL